MLDAEDTARGAAAARTLGSGGKSRYIRLLRFQVFVYRLALAIAAALIVLLAMRVDRGV